MNAAKKPAQSRILLPQLLSNPASANSLEWQPFRPGVEIVRIYGDSAGGASSALLRYAAGATVPRHEHAGYEHILILSGSQTDENATYRAGDLLVNPPGSSHSIRSDDGCLALAIWERGVVFE